MQLTEWAIIWSKTLKVNTSNENDWFRGLMYLFLLKQYIKLIHVFWETVKGKKERKTVEMINYCYFVFSSFE